MTKFSLISILVLIFSTTQFAQNEPVQIKSGKMFVAGINAAGSGTTEFVADNFVSNGNIINNYNGRWFDICDGFGCRAGTSFNDFSLYGFWLENSYQNANILVNGKNYTGIYASGQIEISRNTFQIPQITRKKGRMFFTAPFTMTGRMRFCLVSEFSNPCPNNQRLLDTTVIGHGTLRVTMRINTSQVNNRTQTYLKPGSFEYIFEE